MAPRLVSGMKPTGALHLGNLVGALWSWVRLQDTYEAFCFVADWHAHTTAALPPAAIHDFTRQVAAEYVAAGLDPARAAIFVQSAVPEHAELYLALSLITPVAWLERVPTWKDREHPARGEPATHGLLGYPVLQAADILLYRPTAVPVGSDQLPHVELAREIARRFNHRYGEVFPVPDAIVGEAAILPGLDGQKMSKSRGNVIYLRDTPEATTAKIMAAFTTPTKLRATDPGDPERCVVCRWRRVFDPTGYARSWDEDRRGARGCVQNKRELAALLNDALAPLRARLAALEADPAALDRILAAGATRARASAQATLREVRRAMHLGAASW